ncbi:unnamed protein product [Litomosoides sigmodontis]|uniref:Uncharacterized protein n=1 Tax=Litomosoides sigmodontis TaxID=42156 RepID=A0A3P7K2Q2_LITSI|nr:unnamed protein product [Litomosoides sigmodontis]
MARNSDQHSNCNCIDNDKGDISGSSTNYDNIEITSSTTPETSMSSTTLESAMSDRDIQTLEKLSTYCHSATTVPIRSTITEESSITNTSTNGCNFGHHTSSTTLARPSRAYRIIDSNVSQKILQQLVADKLVAAQTSEKGAKFLKRKGSSRGGPNFIL